jgi:hypothetical protein
LPFGLAQSGSEVQAFGGPEPERFTEDGGVLGADVAGVGVYIVGEYKVTSTLPQSITNIISRASTTNGCAMVVNKFPDLRAIGIYKGGVVLDIGE